MLNKQEFTQALFPLYCAFIHEACTREAEYRDFSNVKGLPVQQAQQRARMILANISAQYYNNPNIPNEFRELFKETF